MAERKRKSRTKRIKIRPLALLLVIIGFFLLLTYVLNLPIFEIKEVVVNGTKMLSSEDVKALAGVPLSENLFFANLSRAKDNLQKIPPIKKAKFYRIPPATILINIEERLPMAAIVFSNNTIIIDDEGFILNRMLNLSLNITNLTELPVIIGMRQQDVFQKEKINLQAAKVLADIIKKLSPYLKYRSMQVDLGNLNNISFMLDDLLKVKLGDERKMAKKMAVFEALLTQVAGKWSKVEYIDVRYPDFPVIKYK